MYILFIVVMHFAIQALSLASLQAIFTAKWILDK